MLLIIIIKTMQIIIFSDTNYEILYGFFLTKSLWQS